MNEATYHVLLGYLDWIMETIDDIDYEYPHIDEYNLQNNFALLPSQVSKLRALLINSATEEGITLTTH